MKPDNRSGQPEGADEHIAGILRSEVETREAIKKIEEERAQSKAQPPTPLVAVLFLVMVALTTWNVVRLQSDDDVFPVERQRAGGEFTVYLTVSAIEQFRDSLGRPPATLEEIGMDDEGVAYTVSGNRYALEVTAGGATFTYSSGEDITPYRAAFERAAAGTEQ